MLTTDNSAATYCNENIQSKNLIPPYNKATNKKYINKDISRLLNIKATQLNRDLRSMNNTLSIGYVIDQHNEASLIKGKELYTPPSQSDIASKKPQKISQIAVFLALSAATIMGLCSLSNMAKQHNIIMKSDLIINMPIIS